MPGTCVTLVVLKGICLCWWARRLRGLWKTLPFLPGWRPASRLSGVEAGQGLAPQQELTDFLSTSARLNLHALGLACMSTCPRQPNGNLSSGDGLG
jgi:hypothetical protein